MTGVYQDLWLGIALEQGLDLAGFAQDSDLCRPVELSVGPWWEVGSGVWVGSEAWSSSELEAQALGEVVWEDGVLGAVLLASLEWVQVWLEPGVWAAAWWVVEFGWGLLWAQVPGQGLAQV